MELIGKISKGTRMDQVYISKQRTPGFEVGKTVLIKSIQTTKDKIKPYYHIKSIEPIKNLIINKIFNYLEYLDNVIIVGSFLEKGFDFDDIDIILVVDEKNKKLNLSEMKEFIENDLGLESHIICMGYKSLLDGLATDPLFQLMLDKFISKKRIIFKKQRKINYKLLDLYTLKSKILIDNYDFLTGAEKYKLIRNLFAVLLFLDNKKLTLSKIDSKINESFGKDTVIKIKENMLDKSVFLKKYKLKYKEVFNKIMDGIKNEQK